MKSATVSALPATSEPSHKQAKWLWSTIAANIRKNCRDIWRNYIFWMGVALTTGTIGGVILLLTIVIAVRGINISPETFRIMGIMGTLLALVGVSALGRAFHIDAQRGTEMLRRRA